MTSLPHTDAESGCVRDILVTSTGFQAEQHLRHTLQPGTVCLILGSQLLLFACVGSYLVGVTRRSEAAECQVCMKEAEALIHQENGRLKDENEELKRKLEDGVNSGIFHPYHAITGSAGHDLPSTYGKASEKTIWSYWYDPVKCPSSKVCVLPPQIQFCVDTVRHNRGSFEYRLVHMDEIGHYVNWLELPIRFRQLSQPQQKDSLMNALLARYGGVAMDISTLLLRPIDDYWDEMVAKGATFRGYMYRINGMPWRHAEVTVVWFLMARREGIFSTAVRNQLIGMGDEANTKLYHHWYLALGDQTLLPILSMFNYSLPKCFDDPTIRGNDRTFPDQNPEWCPEYEQPPWYKGITGPPRNDTTILLRDPRDGPQLPFAFSGMIGWRTDDDRARWNASDFVPGSPMYQAGCSSAKSCWEDVFLRRFNSIPPPGEARLLSFVKLFHHASEFEGKAREDLLADKNSFFYNWLSLAGLPNLD